MAAGNNNGKKIAFGVTVLVVLLAVYYFFVRPRLKAGGYLLPKEYATARGVWENQMLQWIKSDDPNAQSWYRVLKEQVQREPTTDDLLGSIRAAAQSQGAIITIADPSNGTLIYKGSVKAMYGY